MTPRAAAGLNTVSFGEAGKPALLFVHGMAGTAGLWALHYAFGMMRQVQVHAYDLRGHGLSPATPTGYRLDDQADDLEAVRRALGLERVTVLGYSYGGHVATRWAMRHGEQAAGLVVIDTPPLPVQAADIDHMLDGLPSVLAGDFSPAGGFLDAVKQNLQRDIAAGTRPVRALKGRLDALKPTAFREEVLADRPFTDEDFTRIACPVLLVYATQGGNLAYAQRQLSLLRRARQVVLEGGHDIVRTRSAEVRQLLLDFVAGLPAGRPEEESIHG